MWRASLQTVAVLIPRARLLRFSRCRMEKRCFSAYGEDIVVPQQQLERSPMYSSRVHLPEAMAASLRAQYQKLQRPTPTPASEKESRALLDEYAATIKELLARQHIIEAGELMSVLASRLPALVNDPKFVKLLDSGIQCCDSMSINAVSTRFLGSVVPILRHTTVSSAALHKLLYDVLACGAFKHIPSLLDVTIRLKESVGQDVLLEMIRLVLLHGQQADMEKLENYVNEFELYKRDEVLVTYMRKLADRDPHRTLAVYLKYRSFLESIDAETLAKILYKVTLIVFKLNLVPIADDVLDLIRSRGILFSVAAQNLVQFYFKIGNSVKAHELVQQIRASGAPYTSSIYLSLFQKQTDDMRLLLLGKAFDDPECKILPDALVCAITCFWNANDEKTAISTFVKLSRSQESIVELRSSDFGKLADFIGSIASKFETFTTTLAEQSRRDHYTEVLLAFCKIVLLAPWRKRYGAGAGVNPRPFVIHTLLRLLGCIGPQGVLLDALDKLILNGPALSSVTIQAALRYAVSLDVITATVADAFTQRHRLQVTRKEYNRFLTSRVVPEFMDLWKRISQRMRTLDPVYAAQLVQAQGIKIPSPEELPD